MITVSTIKIVHSAGPETIRLYTENIIDNHRRMIPARITVEGIFTRSLRMSQAKKPMVVAVTKRK